MKSNRSVITPRNINCRGVININDYLRRNGNIKENIRTMENQNKAPTVFISYSWDSEEHKKWVSDLSKKLSLYGIKTILDENDLELGDELTEFWKVL